MTTASAQGIQASVPAPVANNQVQQKVTLPTIADTNAALPDSAVSAMVSRVKKKSKTQKSPPKDEVEKVKAEIVLKAQTLNIESTLIEKIRAGVIKGISYVLIPIKHSDPNCNTLIRWLFQEASNKRFSVHEEGMTRDLKEEGTTIEFLNKLSKEEPIKTTGYVFGMENRFWSSLSELGNNYFALKVKGQVLAKPNLLLVNKQLLDNIAVGLVAMLQSSSECQQLWEAFEKSSTESYGEIVKACQLPSAPTHVRANLFFEALAKKYDIFEYATHFTEVIRTLCLLCVDNLSITDKEKPFLQKLVFNNPNVLLAHQLFIDFHHTRRDVIMAGHVLNAPVPPNVVRVIEVGYHHVLGYAPKGSNDPRSLWDVLKEMADKK